MFLRLFTVSENDSFRNSTYYKLSEKKIEFIQEMLNCLDIIVEDDKLFEIAYYDYNDEIYLYDYNSYFTEEDISSKLLALYNDILNENEDQIDLKNIRSVSVMICGVQKSILD